MRAKQDNVAAFLVALVFFINGTRVIVDEWGNWLLMFSGASTVIYGFMLAFGTRIVWK